jgi:hypothetical protein
MQHADEDSEHQGAGVEVDGQRLARDAVGQARASAYDHRPTRALGDTRNEEAAKQSGPPGVAVRRERAREQQRARAEPEARERCAERIDGLAAIGGVDDGRKRQQDLQRVREHERDRRGQQPPVRLQEVKGVTGEAHAERLGGGERAGQQGWQKGTQPAGERQAGAETDVEDEAVHAVSLPRCATVRECWTICRSVRTIDDAHGRPHTSWRAMRRCSRRARMA